MESYIPNLLIAIPALPLLAAAVVAVLGKRVLREQSHWPVALALAGSCLASVLLIFAVQQAEKDHQHEHLVRLWTWATVEAGGERRAGTAGAGSSRVLSTEHSGGTSAVGGTDCHPRLPHGHRAPRRFADGHHARHGHVHQHAGGDLRQRLHARRSGLLAVLRLRGPLRLLDDDARIGEQLRAALRLLGSGGPVQLSAHRLLVREAGGRRGRHEGIPRHPRRRLRFRPGRVPALDHLWHAGLP